MSAKCNVLVEHGTAHVAVAVHTHGVSAILCAVLAWAAPRWVRLLGRETRGRHLLDDHRGALAPVGAEPGGVHGSAV